MLKCVLAVLELPAGWHALCEVNIQFRVLTSASLWLKTAIWPASPGRLCCLCVLFAVFPKLLKDLSGWLPFVTAYARARPLRGSPSVCMWVVCRSAGVTAAVARLLA